MRTREDGWLYFIQEEGGGPIKVGFANDVQMRLKQLQTGNPRQLVLLVAMPGHSELEACIHRCWERYRIRGEWFADCEEIQQAIRHEKQYAPIREANIKRASTMQMDDDPDLYERLRKMVRDGGREEKRRAQASRAFWKRQGLTDAEVLEKMREPL